MDYDALEAVSVHEAVVWAIKQPCPATLYIYDLGGGFVGDEHFNKMENRFPEEGDSAES